MFGCSPNELAKRMIQAIDSNKLQTRIGRRHERMGKFSIASHTGNQASKAEVTAICNLGNVNNGNNWYDKMRFNTCWELAIDNAGIIFGSIH